MSRGIAFSLVMSSRDFQRRISSNTVFIFYLIGDKTCLKISLYSISLVTATRRSEPLLNLISSILLTVLSETWNWIEFFILEILDDIIEVFDSSSFLLCLQIDEESCCRVKVEVLVSQMPIRLIHDCEGDSLLFEKAHRPLDILFLLLLRLLSEVLIILSIRVKSIDICISPSSVWIASSLDDVICTFSHSMERLN